jgi:hypothetical protein
VIDSAVDPSRCHDGGLVGSIVSVELVYSREYGYHNGSADLLRPRNAQEKNDVNVIELTAPRTERRSERDLKETSGPGRSYIKLRIV